MAHHVKNEADSDVWYIDIDCSNHIYSSKYYKYMQVDKYNKILNTNNNTNEQ